MSRRTDQLINYMYESDNHKVEEKEEEIFTKKKLKPITPGHFDYMDSIEKSIITICAGPAGSSKTYTSIAMSVQLLVDRKFKRIVITRPALECGERLGYLPGTADRKVEPYTLPVMDVLNEFLDKKVLKNYLDSGIIEFCPLAYMRGRTLHDTILVLDEAQNCKEEQLKMFMTRIGNNSKIIMSGDTTQTDLDKKRENARAYEDIVRKFDRAPYVDGITVIYMTEADIVRHSLIGKIIAKFEEV